MLLKGSRLIAWGVFWPKSGLLLTSVGIATARTRGDALPPKYGGSP